jgi:predicted porin
MEALWYHYDVPRFPLGVSAVFMNVGLQNSDLNQDTCTYQQQLLGTYIHFHPKHLTAEAAFYYQMGKEEHGIPVGAWMASLKARYEFNDQWAFYAGYDYLSGDKNFAVPPKGRIGVTHHDKVRGFSSINGSHHKFYGAMDFFYITTYVNGFTPGLQNLFAGTTWKPLNRLSVDLAYHYLATTVDLKYFSRALGHELELTASYQFWPYAKLSAGYSFMVGTDTMKELKRASDSGRLHWAWLSLNITPRILSTKW